MFTGIIQAVGQIEQVERREPGVHVLVRSEPIGAASLNVGDSIAVNGCCLTVTAIDGRRFQADLSEETLARTANLDRCGPVNLELSLAVGDRSLTINRVEDSEHACDVTINLIPHTLAATTLGRLLPGQRVNLEVDPLARYAERMISLMAPALSGKRT